MAPHAAAVSYRLAPGADDEEGRCDEPFEYRDDASWRRATRRPLRP
jgi:hypothetical protein